MEPKKCYCDIVLNSITEGVFTVDRDMSVTAFNRAAERMTGLAADKAVGAPVADLLCEETCPVAGLLLDAVEKRKETAGARVEIRHVDGRSIPVSLSTAALREDDGEIVGAVATFRDLSGVEDLRKRLHLQYTFEDIISANHRVRRLFDILPDVAVSDSTVLIEGPSGSGKELFAQAIHNLSGRSGKRLVVVNCGALPDNLLESELFGYVRGAFTDARKDKPGRFALAEGGTIFLDEIGDVSPALQVKLLRVLQEREFEPLGATETVRADVRVIAATNKSLAGEVAAGRFREDLFYRLNVVRIPLPPLSERREDVPLLVEHFIGKFNARMGKAVQRVSEDVMDLLMRHPLPGNVRELNNIVEHAFILCHGPEIRLEHLPVDLAGAAPAAASSDSPGAGLPSSPVAPGRSMVDAEVAAIRSALERNGGNRARTAAELGIDKSTLWRKMKRYAIDYPRS